MADIDLSKYGQVVQPSPDLSKYGQVVPSAPGVPNPLQANPEKYTPEGLKLAPWGVPSSGPHKSFADTVGHDSLAGKAADTLGSVSEFLPSNDAMIGLAAPGVAGPPGAGGTSGLIKRAITLGGGVATQWGVEKGLRAMGVPEPLVRVLSDAAGFGVASKMGHGKVERPIETTDLGTTSPAAKIPFPAPKPATPSKVFVGSSGTVSGEIAPPETPAPNATAGLPSGPATLDEIVQSLSKGKIKTFAKASPQDQQAALATHNALARTAAKAEAIPAGLTAPKTPAPTATTPSPISKPLGGVSPADNETNLVNTLRGNTTRKNLEIGQYFTAKGMTPEQVAAMPEAQFNSHIRNVKNASGNPYQPSTGRNYHRTPEQARADVVNAMRAMQPLPAPTMPTMIAAPPAPRGYFPPPTWPPQPPVQ